LAFGSTIMEACICQVYLYVFCFCHRTTRAPVNTLTVFYGLNILLSSKHAIAVTVIITLACVYLSVWHSTAILCQLVKHHAQLGNSLGFEHDTILTLYYNWRLCYWKCKCGMISLSQCEKKGQISIPLTTAVIRNRKWCSQWDFTIIFNEHCYNYFLRKISKIVILQHDQQMRVFNCLTINSVILVY
jgi:hypothetical protein